MPRKPINKIGEVYGKLTVVSASKRRTRSGNAFWWCLCECGKKREVSSDCLSKTKRAKKNIHECHSCAKEISIQGAVNKNAREETIRRKNSQKKRLELKGKVPEEWLNLPLTDSHAREMKKKIFFRGLKCLKGHLSPYRINGGCLECALKKNELL